MRAMATNRFSSGTGPSQRQLRVGELIRRTLSEALSRQEIHDSELNAMSITVGEVRVSPDLRVATVYVLPLGGKGQEEAIAALKRANYELRRLVAKNVLLKSVPELRYLIDETFDRMDATRRMFADEKVQRDLAAPGDDATDGDEKG
ncbi:MAG: 30S ribosome-binding factor RbfA [Cereibacter sphaeroides]|uniref:Ribosome-binding factor A n=1 Tax=Cereibacter sphaeroides TaxID=1063 RepID=A0A2W5SEX7_CERSP|nr:MAG: 30S ribosome-binding factor RbfA [Cereibacter sphaeroides]